MALTKVRKRMSLRTVNNFTSNQTLTDSHDLVTGDSTGGAFTFTLPTASTLTGKEFTIQKISSDFSAITIGSLTAVHTNGETVTIYSNGSAWVVKSRYIPSVKTTYSPSLSSTGSTPTKGTIVRDTAFWKRIGDEIEICYDYEQSSGGTQSGGVTNLFGLPTGLSIDTAKRGVTTGGEIRAGYGVYSRNADGFASVTVPVQVLPYDSTHFAFATIDIAGGALDDAQASQSVDFSLTNMVFSITARFPITGWNG